MQKFILCSLLFFASCAHVRRGTEKTINDIADFFIPAQKVDLPPIKFEPDLAGFSSDFVQDAAVRGVIIPQTTVSLLRQIVYVDALSSYDGPGVMAVCSRYYETTRDTVVRWMIIEVLKSELQMYTQGEPMRLKEVMYHELYHCYMNKGHLPADIPGLMDPTFSRANMRVYTDWKGLIDEAFSQEYLNLTPDATYTASP